jgi:hypothetical protein
MKGPRCYKIGIVYFSLGALMSGGERYSRKKGRQSMNAEELERWRRPVEAALSKVDYEHAKESLANLAGTAEAFLPVLRPAG